MRVEAEQAHLDRTCAAYDAALAVVHGEPLPEPLAAALSDGAGG
jgi:hypothetical protein